MVFANRRGSGTGNAHSVAIFDNVFVPWERVFLCGETKHAGQMAQLFATYHRHSYTGCKPAMTDILMGSAALVADYNGIAKDKQFYRYKPIKQCERDWT